MPYNLIFKYFVYCIYILHSNVMKNSTYNHKEIRFCPNQYHASDCDLFLFFFSNNNIILQK